MSRHRATEPDKLIKNDSWAIQESDSDMEKQGLGTDEPDGPALEIDGLQLENGGLQSHCTPLCQARVKPAVSQGNCLDLAVAIGA